MKVLTITLLVASVLSIAPAVQSQGRKSLKPSFEPPLLSLGVAGPASMVASAQGVARSWSYSGSLNIARAYHTATLLSDGKVLVTGGLGVTSVDHSPDIAELYDPAAGTWSVTGRLNVPRGYHTATLLPDGKVLVVGGSDSFLNTAELYDPGTGTWTVTGGLSAWAGDP